MIESYLNNKPIYYKKIDYERFPRAFAGVREIVNLKNVIHIVGTNGKGSTGRFLTQIIRENGHSVGHYTSPHIFEFAERFYINDRIATSCELDVAHQILQDNLSDEFKQSLSYFEYATLIAGVLFRELDYCVIEAGMGARYDATSQFDRILSLFTPIGMDHVGMLGSTLEEIARTKLISMQKRAILNDAMDLEVNLIAKEIAGKNHTDLKFADEYLNSDERAGILAYIEKNDYPNFQKTNLALAVAGAKALSLEPKLAELKPLSIQGRLQKIAKNITIDVGHNEMAAAQIVKSFQGKKIVLIYNAFADKDVASIMKILKPIVKRVEIFDYESRDRELIGERIFEILNRLEIEFKKFDKISENEEYLAFGSFHLVENFLKKSGI